MLDMSRLLGSDGRALCGFHAVALTGKETEGDGPELK